MPPAIARKLGFLGLFGFLGILGLGGEHAFFSLFALFALFSLFAAGRDSQDQPNRITFNLSIVAASCAALIVAVTVFASYLAA